ncbi:MAG: hypothetical protein PHE61_00395 [Candidatus Omnitrophica bacterium]|nr:hypothetical protein [Candidatus Omnitrophota bacterium]
MKKIPILIAFFALFSVSRCFAEIGKEMQYKNIKGDDVSCVIKALFEKTTEGMDAEVAAIGTGRGSNFRMWEVSKINLSINGKIIGPSKSDYFYSTKETFLKWAGAALFGYTGARSKLYDSGIAMGIDRVGMAAGLGVMSLAATGQLTGLKCVFKLDSGLAADVGERGCKVRVTLVNIDSGKKEILETEI